MLRITNLGVMSFILLALAACSSSSGSSYGSSLVVTDTKGWKYDVYCSGGLCTLAPLDSHLVPTTCESGTGTETFILVPFSLLSIYAAVVPTSGPVQFSAAEPSRPVACGSDADCLPAGTVMAGASYACTNGLCQCSSQTCTTTDGNPTTYEVLTLCQADLDWPTACPYITTQPYASRISEIATICGSTDTCTAVPADCRQLTPSSDGGGQPTPVAPIDGGAQSAPVDSSVDSGPSVDVGSVLGI
jgi:hypothetical protein